MRICEQPNVSEYLDEKGIRMGDRIRILPLAGRKMEFSLNRTCVDFVSKDLEASLENPFFRVLGAQREESFHVRMKQECTFGRSGHKSKQRFIIQVLAGGPIKINGVYLFSCYLEEGDRLEIGYNSVFFERVRSQDDFDPQMKFVQENKRIIKSDLPLLIEGETGVGKTSLALKIHQISERPGEFIHINLAAFGSGLIESEIFGHVKGAFTGAMNDKKGAFREAQGGTLFIDEIDSLPLGIQTKLLVFLDNFKIRPVGGSTDYEVNIRIIFSSGQKLENLVNQGVMRKDFFYRISCGETFKLAALRHDPDRIIKFWELFSIEHNIVISQKLKDFYQNLPWPGNYRQLKGHLERKKVLTKGSKLDFDKADEVLIAKSSDLLGLYQEQSLATLEEVKNAYALKVFHEAGKNFNKAAEQLSISSRSLRKIINGIKIAA